jgi:hypothetical protein
LPTDGPGGENLAVATIEIEEFQLASGVTDEGFLAMDASFQEYSYLHRAGLQRRTTCRAGAGWAVVSYWEAGSDAGSSGANDAWRAAIEPSSYSRREFVTLG